MVIWLIAFLIVVETGGPSESVGSDFPAKPHFKPHSKKVSFTTTFSAALDLIILLDILVNRLS
jgi:hypothetical protein